MRRDSGRASADHPRAEGPSTGREGRAGAASDVIEFHARLEPDRHFGGGRGSTGIVPAFAGIPRGLAGSYRLRGFGSRRVTRSFGGWRFACWVAGAGIGL